MIDCINKANVNNPQDDTIDLGGFTFVLTTPDNPGNGLPIIGADSGHTLTIQNGTITRDTSSGTPLFRILEVAAGANLTIDNSTISGGNTTSSGGGILNNVGTLTVTNSTISGNTAIGGGGIYNDAGTVTVTGSTLSGNITDIVGGGGIANVGGGNVTNSTLSGNTAAGGGSTGGGIYNSGTLEVTNSTLSGNTAASGGGIYDSTTGTLTVNNTIVTGSVGGDLVPFQYGSGSNNLSDGSVPGGNPAVTGFDTALQNNGGPTLTHALLPGSNAIDAGNNSFITLPTDQRGVGFNRQVNPTGIGIPMVDIGAFERQCQVTNTADSGNGSLRAAIHCANAAPGTDIITFDIPGPGPHTITPFLPLPTITDAVVIDAKTEPDFAGTPVVELDGSSAGPLANGLLILAGPSTVRGLVINGFGRAGIQLGQSGGHLIECNYIGTDVGGTLPVPNGTGIRLSKSYNNTIGTVSARNVISGNTNAGIRIVGALSTGNMIQNNMIGTDVNGNSPVANHAGVEIIVGQSNTVGGTAPLQRNVISGNTTVGILLRGDGNLVIGNRIGTNVLGTGTGIPNADGVLIRAATSNSIGGTALGAGNLISGNSRYGVVLAGASATHNLVVGNLIGTDMSGLNALPNRTGVAILGASNNTIGSFGAGNTISGNSRYGVLVKGAGASSNVVQANRIGTNMSGNGPLDNRIGVAVLGAPNNTIGSAGAGNTISGNLQHGVLLSGAVATGNQVQGNQIGTDVGGTYAVGNLHGITINNAPSNTIGGAAAGAGNIISGNTLKGVRLLKTGATGNVVQGNQIGVDAIGLPIPNQDGVFIARGTNDTLVGGTFPGAPNEIAENARVGVFVTGNAGTGNAIRQNSIHDNGGSVYLGIALQTLGPLPNDVFPNVASDDVDLPLAANRLQNWPEIQSVQIAVNPAFLDVTFRVRSATPLNSDYPLTIEFFIADAANQEGETFLDAMPYFTASPFITVPILRGAATANDRIVATATDDKGNTSEFSVPAIVT